MANRIENPLYSGKNPTFQTIVLEDGPLKGQEWEVGEGVLGVYIPEKPGSKKSHHYRCREGKWIYEARTGGDNK